MRIEKGATRPFIDLGGSSRVDHQEARTRRDEKIAEVEEKKAEDARAAAGAGLGGKVDRFA